MSNFICIFALKEKKELLTMKSAKKNETVHILYIITIVRTC